MEIPITLGDILFMSIILALTWLDNVWFDILKEFPIYSAKYPHDYIIENILRL